MAEQAIPDYSADLPAPSSDKLEQLTKLAEHQQELEERAAQKEEEHKAAKALLRDVAEQQIPPLMAECNLKTFTTASGITVKVEEDLRVSVPKKNVPQCMAWLEGNGLASIIKRAFTIRFGRDDERWANKFERDCKQRKKPLDIERTRKVESSTLKKNLNQLREQGVDVPLKLFGAYEQKVSKISVD